MPKIKNKPVELWPAWDSPSRQTAFEGRPELKESIYKRAGHGFTADNFSSIQAALERACGRIPADFGLLARLQLAAYDYHMWSGGRRGEVEVFDLLPGSVKFEKLETLRKRAKDLLSFCERNPRLIRFLADDDEEVDCPDPEFCRSLCGELRFLNRMAAKAIGTVKKRDGRESDKARRVFYMHLLKTFEDATGRKATSTVEGPFYDFCAACFTHLIAKSKEVGSSIQKHVKETIRDRRFIPQYFGEPESVPLAFTSQVVIPPRKKSSK
jgi:hypothetical protein